MYFNFILIAVYLGLGLALRHFGILGDRGAKRINIFVVNGALPAMAFVGLRGVTFDPRLLVPISMAWLLFGLSAACFCFVGAGLGWPRRTVGALVLTAGLANTSFLGFPLLEALIGPEAIPTAVVADQFGSFLVLATVATIFAGLYARQSVEPKKILMRLAVYPPLLAVLLTLALRHVPIPDLVLKMLGYLAMTLAPLSLLSVGLSLRLRGVAWRGMIKPVGLGLLFKLILAPAVFTLLYLVILDQRDLAAHVTILESAMAPMIMGSVLAFESGFDRDVTGTMVLLGIPLSLATVPAWHMLLSAMLG